MSRRGSRREVDAVERDRAGGRLDEPQHAAARGGLAGAGLRRRARRSCRGATSKLTSSTARTTPPRAANGKRLQLSGRPRRRVRASRVCRRSSVLVPAQAAAHVARPGVSSSGGHARVHGVDRGTGSAARRSSPAAASATARHVARDRRAAAAARRPLDRACCGMRGAAAPSCRGGAAARTAHRPAPPRRRGRHTSPRRGRAISATTPRLCVMNRMRHAESRPAAAAAGPGSAPGWSRRARSSARRR